MKKLSYLIAFIGLTACGQKTTNGIKTDISNSKTSQHINIPGTRLYIIPPPGFKVASTFIGLQKGESSMINIYDLVGGNINSNAATFNRAEFERHGATVFEFKEIKVHGLPAKFIHMQGEPTAKSYSLVFGDTTFTTMIMAIYPVADETTGNDILVSLNSIFYDKSKKIDPFETARFSLTGNTSKFRFAQYNANLYIYTIDGKENVDKDAPVVLVSQLPKDKTMTAKSIADMMIAKSGQYSFTDTEFKNISTENINGYEAYQVEVYGKMKGKYALIYFCIVTSGDKAIAIQGVATKDMELNLQEFKKISQSIRIK